jgi:hypothetical protein
MGPIREFPGPLAQEALVEGFLLPHVDMDHRVVVGVVADIHDLVPRHVEAGRAFIERTFGDKIAEFWRQGIGQLSIESQTERQRALESQKVLHARGEKSHLFQHEIRAVRHGPVRHGVFFGRHVDQADAQPFDPSDMRLARHFCQFVLNVGVRVECFFLAQFFYGLRKGVDAHRYQGFPESGIGWGSAYQGEQPGRDIGVHGNGGIDANGFGIGGLRVDAHFPRHIIGQSHFHTRQSHRIIFVNARDDESVDEILVSAIF